MPDELIAYIQDQTERGASRDEITKTLKEVGGWTEDDISGAFATLDGKKPQEPSMLIADTSPKTKEPIEKEKTTEPAAHTIETEQTPTKKKRPIIRTLSIISAVVIFVLVCFTAYRYFMPASKTADMHTLIQRDGNYFMKGNIILPAGVNLPTKITSSPAAPYAVLKVAPDGTFEIQVKPDAINKIIAVAPDKEFSYIAIVLPEDIKKNPFVRIDASSTAISLVFLNAQITSSDPTTANSTLSLIKTDEAVRSFSTVLTDKIATSADPSNDTEFKAALGKAVESILAIISKK